MEASLDCYSTSSYYNYYRRKNLKFLSKSQYIEIINFANSLIKDYLLEGFTLNMGFGLGALRIVRKKQDPNKPAINIVETMKARANDPEALVYYTHDYYCFLKHCKPINSVVFFRSHKFIAVRGVDSITKRLWILMQSNSEVLNQFSKNALYQFGTRAISNTTKPVKLKLRYGNR
jgi:hypothetical protein